MSDANLLAIVPLPRQLAWSGRSRVLAPSGLAMSGPSSLVGAVAALASSSGGPAVRSTTEAEADVVVELLATRRPATSWRPIGLDPTAFPGVPVGDESYEIVPDGERLILRAASERGAFLGLVTVLQALGGASELPLFEAADAPQLRWRGLSVDVARHFLSMTELEAIIDLAAYYKLNVVHLHLTDNQAWRLTMPAWPLLTPDANQAYTAAQLQELAAYATRRHVVLVPEIDMPGHVAFASVAYPTLMGDHEVAHPGLSHLRPDVDEAMRFARDAVSLLCSLVPTPYVHIGGDEAFGMDAALYGEFVRTVHGWVGDAGKVAVAWQEATRSEGTFGAGGVVQYWVTPRDAPTAEEFDRLLPPEYAWLRDTLLESFVSAPADLPRAVDANAWILLSPSYPFYLDRRYGEASAAPAQAELMARLGHSGYQALPTSELYTWQPTDVPGIADGVRVAGAEAAIWAESIESFDDLAALVLPRLPVLAEVMWTPERSDWASAAARVASHVEVWRFLGFGGFYRSAEIFRDHAVR